MDFDAVFGGTERSILSAISLCSLDWNVTHSPSHSGICDAWFGIRNFATRDLGWCGALVTPRQFIWSFTNCDIVTISFSQFRTVALSMDPRLELEQAQRAKSNGQMAKILILMLAL